MFGKFGLAFESGEINCVVVEVIKRSDFKWFDHLERMEMKAELTKRVY